MLEQCNVPCTVWSYDIKQLFKKFHDIVWEVFNVAYRSITDIVVIFATLIIIWSVQGHVYIHVYVPTTCMCLLKWEFANFTQCCNHCILLRDIISCTLLSFISVFMTIISIVKEGGEVGKMAMRYSSCNKMKGQEPEWCNKKITMSCTCMEEKLFKNWLKPHSLLHKSPKIIIAHEMHCKHCFNIWQVSQYFVVRQSDVIIISAVLINWFPYEYGSKSVC